MSKNLVKVSANPEVIQWARKHARLSLGEVGKSSKLSKLTESRLKKIESGEEEATISEILEFSRILKRPFALFFLPTPPSPIPTLPDKRTGVPEDGENDLALSLAIARAYEVQELISDLAAVNRKQLPAVPIPPMEVKSDPERLAEWLRKRMGIESVFGGSRRKPDEALAYWIRNVEKIGVVILQETFSPDTSAFSIGGVTPPVSVLCFKDAERRRIFSLFHELAHIVLRQSAICNLTFERAEHDEKFCDKFAASFLMPESEVRALSEKTSFGLDKLAQTMSNLSGASVESAFLRLVDLGLATFDDYNLRKQEWHDAYAAWLRQQKKKGGGPNPNPVGTAIKKGGVTLSRYVSDAFQGGQISRADASQAMKLPALEIPNLVRRVK